jgi:hypothetical protein
VRVVCSLSCRQRELPVTCDARRIHGRDGKWYRRPMKCTSILSALVILSAALGGCGWSQNQKDGVKQVVSQGFEKGLAKDGKTVDPKVLDAWATCFADKVAQRWKSFDDFKSDQTNPDAEKFRKDCADQTKLFDAITVKK